MKAGRPREFDECEALERAMQLFWTRGYAGTRLAELLTEMRISRQSLYDTFGNKRALFLRAIEHYRATQLTQALALLEREGSPLENVKAAYGFFRELAADDRCRGCFVANALVEVAPHDPEIAELLEETLDLLQHGLEVSLERAQAQGELAEDRSPRCLAQVLTNSMLGMVVNGKLRRGPAALREIYDGTLAILG